MKYTSDLVSVIIPTYHRCDSLKRAIDTVLGQTYENIECIVVNDNTPSDEYSLGLYKLIEEYRTDKRFVFIEQEKHINGAEARNCGIRNAKGEYIAFLDDDDWWKSDKIEKQVAFIKAQDMDCGGVSTLVEFYKGNEVFHKSQPYSDGKICVQILRREVDVTTCSVLLKHRCLDEAGYFDNSLRRHQEIQLLAYFTDKYEIKLLEEYLTCVTYDDPGNVPNSEQLQRIKEDFFRSVEPILSKLPKAERKRIQALHMFELAYVYYKEKKYGQCFRYAITVLSNPKTFSLALKRVFERYK